MKDELTESVQAQIPGASVDIVVEGNRALIAVVSDAFAGLSRVQKQQRVYACIREPRAYGRLHAVTIRALMPADAAAGQAG